MELRAFYFDHPQLFVVPVEHQSPTGVTEEFRAVAAEERTLPGGFFDLLDEAVAKQFERQAPLYAQARRQWFPPRRTNLCIVTEPRDARPYYQPFIGNSLLMYASDFDPAESNVEFATYQLLHAERLSIVRNMAKTVVGNLGYFLLRSEAERQAFAEAAIRCTRPDAAGFAALGEAMSWVGDVLHQDLKPPLLRTDGLTELPGTGLLLTDEQAGALGPLIEAFESAGRGVIEGYYTAQAESLGGPSAAERITTFVLERRPRLLLADAKDRVIWDPDHPERTEAIADAAASICERAAQAICRDLEMVSSRTEEILGRLRDPSALPSHGDEVQQEGGVYLHEERGLMVYSLHQPGVNTQREGTPPFHAWLLGARMAHEWGHLAADADLVRVAPERRSTFTAAKAELTALFDAIVKRAPEKVRAQAEEHFAGRTLGTSIGEAMLEMQLKRIGDFKSNVFAQAVLPVEEMEAYVRVNVRPLAAEPGSFLSKLARYAYEFQYLGFSRMEDPKHYFFSSTWFVDNYIDTGILSREDAERMLDLMGEVCKSYTLSPDALHS